MPSRSSVLSLAHGQVVEGLRHGDVPFSGIEAGAAQDIALGTLPVRLLPYDRDAIFDSLAQAYPEPEPQVPDSIQQLQEVVTERRTALGGQEAGRRAALAVEREEIQAAEASPEALETARQILQELLGHMGYSATVSIQSGETYCWCTDTCRCPVAK